MSDNVQNAIIDRATLVTRRTTQAYYLLEVLNMKLPLICTISDDFEQTIRNALLNEHYRLVMIDAAAFEPSAIVEGLAGFGEVIPRRVVTVILNVQSGADWPAEVIPRGVRGVFTTEDNLHTIQRGLDAVLAGDVWVPRRLLLEAALGGKWARPIEPRPQDGLKPLTSREREILSLVCTGASNDEVASHLNISGHTVKTHLYNIYRKIEVPNRMQAILWGAKNL